MLDSFSRKIFQVASFNLFYGSLPAKVIRAVVGLFLTLLLLLPLSTDSSRTPYFAFSVLLAFLMFEAFYRFKLARFTPNRKVGESQNWQDSLSLSLAEILLTNPNWDSVGITFARLAKARLCSLVLARADFGREQINELIKTTQAEKLDLATVITKAAEFTKLEKRSYTDEVDLLVALLETNPTLNQALTARKLKPNDLLNISFWIRGEEPKAIWETKPENLGNGMGELWVGGWTPATEAITRDLSKGLLKGEFDGTLIGRDKEMYQIEEVLSRTSKKNIILLGEPGVGKEALIYGLALKSIRGELPAALKYKRVLELDLTALLADAPAGQLEAKVQTILQELSHAGNVILYLPQLENIAGSGVDLTSLLIGELERGKMQVIATTNRSNYHRFIEQKPAFSATFEIIDVAEPSQDEIIRILEGRSTDIEKKHKVTITYRALFSCVELAGKYLLDRAFPGKAIDLLDEVAAAVALRKKPLVETTDLEEVLTQKTKVPVALAKGDESEKLLKLEETLHQRVVGQEDAIQSVSEAVRRARTMEREGTRPIGVFLFLGPTGVGKTETAKALSQVYFGDEKNIIRLDMSEFEEETAINRLIGPSPGQPGFESGGQLTEAVRVRPFSLLLLDEMEKAHQKVQEAFLAVFDEGRIADSSGRTISFTNTIIIATSNAGAEFIREAINRGETSSQFRVALMDKLQKEAIFKPEFLNRFDDVIVFKPLQANEVQKIVEIRIAELTKRLEKQNIKISLTPEALTYLATKGYDPTYGARSLRRLLQDEVEGLISKELLTGNLKEGSNASITSSPNGLILSSNQTQQAITIS